MGFRLIALGEERNRFEALSQTDRLSGTVVAGRADYRETDSGGSVIDNVDIDNYVDIEIGEEDEYYSRKDWAKLSRNHFLVAERINPEDVNELQNNGAESVTVPQHNGVLWDLNSTNGTYSRQATFEDSPVYQAGPINLAVENIPDFYLGFEAGSDLDGTENDIREMSSNLGNRGFETYTIQDAEWTDVKGHARHIGRKADPESTVFMQYSGHGTETGRMVLEDGAVTPQKFFDLAEEIDGRKVVVVDQCYAANFETATLPEDTMLLYSSGRDQKAYETDIKGQKMGRYAGRLVNEFENDQGEINLERMHQRLEDVTKINNQGAGYQGTSIDLTGVK